MLSTRRNSRDRIEPVLSVTSRLYSPFGTLPMRNRPSLETGARNGDCVARLEPESSTYRPLKLLHDSHLTSPATFAANAGRNEIRIKTDRHTPGIGVPSIG